MGKDVASSRFSKQDFKNFEKKLLEETLLLEQWFCDGMFAKEHPRGGFELEAWLVDDKCHPAPINEEFLKRCNSKLVVPELSKFNVEMNGNPLSLKKNALQTLQGELNSTWSRCDQIARQLNASLVMIGTLPTIRERDLNLDNMSQLERYRALNEQVLRLRKGHPLALNIQGNQHLRTAHYDVMMESAATSFQIHLQVEPDHAVRMYNAAHIISAPIVAASANSPYLFGKDLWDESRIPIFEQSVAASITEDSSSQNTSSGKNLARVSFGTEYIKNSLFECFQENLASYPILLPASTEDAPERLAHVRLHNGTIWRWNRPLIGFDSKNKPHLRIEHRVVPSGPTIIDSFANAAFFFGLVYFYGNQPCPPESLLEFSQAKDNFYNAARLGLRSKITWLDGKNTQIKPLILEELIPKSRTGLERLGINNDEIDYYMDIIAQRVRLNRTGSAWQRAYLEKHQCDMSTLTAAYLENQQLGKPVHEWSL